MLSRALLRGAWPAAAGGWDWGRPMKAAAPPGVLQKHSRPHPGPPPCGRLHVPTPAAAPRLWDRPTVPCWLPPGVGCRGRAEGQLTPCCPGAARPRQPPDGHPIPCSLSLHPPPPPPPRPAWLQGHHVDPDTAHPPGVDHSARAARWGGDTRVGPSPCPSSLSGAASDLSTPRVPVQAV